MLQPSYSIKAILSAAICTLMVASSNPLLAGQSDALRVEIASQKQNGFVAVFNFGSSTLKTAPDGSGNEHLWVDLPGAVLNFDHPGIAVPTFTRLVAVPEGCTVRARVNDRELRTSIVSNRLTDEIASLKSLESLPQSAEVVVGEPGWMRWLRVVPVTIRPVYYALEEHRIRSAEQLEVEFEFIPDGSGLSRASINRERCQSIAFDELFKALLLNPPDDLHNLPGGTVIKRGSYIIITDSVLVQVCENFADWKRRKGFEVVVKPWDVEGITAETLKDSIQFVYDNWERPPEFVLLLGDVNAAGIRLPAFTIENPATGETDVTDHPYSLLSGDDYFPDIFVGRISSDSPSPEIALKGMARSTLHEKNIAAFPTANFHRATLFASNFSDGGVPVFSPVETMRWLGERLQEKNFDVEEFYYTSPGDEISPDQIVASINRGVNIISYRGWSDANGAHYPPFYRQHLEELDNGPLLPIFTFFNCNAGDFGNDQINPCFGEYSISRGTRVNPLGALSFYGLSDLHAQTRYNNAALAGFYQGLLYEDLRVMGALTLRSKMEIWNGFPEERGHGDQSMVEFYFNIYNLLGDPEQSVYLDPPTPLEVTHRDTVHYGNSNVEVVVRDPNGPVAGAIVTLQWDGDKQESILTDNEGRAVEWINISDSQAVNLTVIAHQAAPYLATLPVVRNNYSIGYYSAEIENEFNDDRLIAGSPISIGITLQNTGLQDVRGVAATLSSPIGGVEVERDEVSFGDIPVNARVSGQTPFHLVVAPDIPDGCELLFTLDIQDADNHQAQSQFRLPVRSALLSYDHHTIERGALPPGENRELVLAVKNLGSLDVADLSSVMFSTDNSISIQRNVAHFGDIRRGEVGDCTNDPFVIRAHEGVTPGRIVTLQTVFRTGNFDEVGRVCFNITVGEPDASDPMGPDNYGYYVYENIDDHGRYSEAPDYQWIELDPNFGGQGAESYSLEDDATVVVNLPFPFSYYGAEYDTISICSNGWLCFTASWMRDFRNWGIPSPLGPHAMIAPFWDDLRGTLQGDMSRAPITIYTRYDPELGRFTIQWSGAVARGRNGEEHSETFEVILFDPTVRHTTTGDGEILFQYREAAVVDIGLEQNYATVGIQDWNHQRGLEVTFAGHYPAAIDSLRPGRAIKFTTIPPDTFLATSGEAPICPAEFELFEPRPNPFNGSVQLIYGLPEACEVKLNIFDISGRMVANLVNGSKNAGVHSIIWEAGNMPTGVYLARIESAGQERMTKLTLLK